jgi:transposase-like protein
MPFLTWKRIGCVQRNERGEAWQDTRPGYYGRNLQTKSGEVRLRVPKLRHQTFVTAAQVVQPVSGSPLH